MSSYIGTYSFTFFSANETHKVVFIHQIGLDGVKWIHLAQDKEKWRAI
jgi:hypothetical protein